MTRRCRCVHGVRSARNEYRHPGVPGTRNKGSPAASPNSDQATIRPSGRSRLRSRTPSRTASVTIGNPDKALGQRQPTRGDAAPRVAVRDSVSGEPRTGPQNIAPGRLPARPDGWARATPGRRRRCPLRCVDPWSPPTGTARSGAHVVPGSRTVTGQEPHRYGQAGFAARWRTTPAGASAQHVRHTRHLWC